MEAQQERTYIMIKPDGVQRSLVARSSQDLRTKDLS